MPLLQLAALLMIVGFLFIVAASMVGPPRLYREPSVQKQLALIAAHATPWRLSNECYGLGGLITAGGLILFWLHLRGSGPAWLAGAGSALYLLGMLAYALFLYRRTIDPASLFTSYAFSPLTVLLVSSAVAGLLLLGAAFLQAGYPAWLGLGFVAGTALIGGAALVYPAAFFKFFPPQVLFLFTLVAGVVMLARS